MTFFNIENRKIGDNEPAFIIAEIGANHNGDINLALELISVAKKCGVDCVKFQTYTPSECLSEDKEFEYYSKGKKIKESEFNLLNRLALKESDWKIIKKHCQKEGIIFMTTIQDEVDLDLMMKLGLSSIKKGSDDFNYIPNLISVAKTGLPSAFAAREATTSGEIASNSAAKFTSASGATPSEASCAFGDIEKKIVATIVAVKRIFMTCTSSTVLIEIQTKHTLNLKETID